MHGHQITQLTLTHTLTTCDKYLNVSSIESAVPANVCFIEGAIQQERKLVRKPLSYFKFNSLNNFHFQLIRCWNPFECSMHFRKWIYGAQVFEFIPFRIV